MGNDLRPVAADGDKNIKLHVSVVIDHLLRGIDDTNVVPLSHRKVERISFVRGPQDRASLVNDPQNIHRRQFTMAPLHHPLIAVQNADDGRTVIVHCRFRNTTNDRVQAWTVASPGQYPDAFEFHGFVGSSINDQLRHNNRNIRKNREIFTCGQ